MKLGMIGLGRMGANMAQRLLRGGLEVVGFDLNPEALGLAADAGAETAGSMQELVAALPVPRAVWLMLPAGAITDAALDQLLPLLDVGDIVVDGGNSHFEDTLRRADTFAAANIDYIDCGTSGGVWGLGEGYCLMIGGSQAAVERLRAVFETLAPDKDSGWGRVGPVGAGHYAKMIHNGIEYGMMQAYAEGFSILKHKRQFDLDLHQVAQLWRHGSVVRSWLLDLIAVSLAENPQMDGIAPYVADSGEGRWTVAEAIHLDVPAPVITLSLLARLRSRDADSYADKLLAALRHQFGGHGVKKE